MSINVSSAGRMTMGRKGGWRGQHSGSISLEVSDHHRVICLITILPGSFQRENRGEEGKFSHFIGEIWSGARGVDKHCALRMWRDLSLPIGAWQRAERCHPGANSLSAKPWVGDNGEDPPGS